MVGILTVLSLVYINLQMQIFDLAYQAKKKEKEIHRLADENGGVTYNILNLKSANHLGVKLLSQDSNMQFLDHASIVWLITPQSILKNYGPVVANKAEKKPNMLMNLFSLRSQAEAKPIE